MANEVYEPKKPVKVHESEGDAELFQGARPAPRSHKLENP